MDITMKIRSIDFRDLLNMPGINSFKYPRINLTVGITPTHIYILTWENSTLTVPIDKLSQITTRFRSEIEEFVRKQMVETKKRWELPCW